MSSDGVTVSRIENLARLRTKILKLGGPQAVSTLKAANQKNADEFKGVVARIVPRDDDAALLGTLTSYDVGPTGAAVAIGDAHHPYPLHLEAGHRNSDGSVTPAKPFWNPAKREQRKRWKSRSERAARSVAKSIASAGGG
jgi:hypothetical protein